MAAAVSSKPDRWGAGPPEGAAACLVGVRRHLARELLAGHSNYFPGGNRSLLSVSVLSQDIELTTLGVEGREDRVVGGGEG